MKSHPSGVSKSLQQRTFTCNDCGQRSSAPKYKGRTGIGHIKDMYCYRCKKVTKHTQVE